jgi:hypothetical protein
MPRESGASSNPQRIRWLLDRPLSRAMTASDAIIPRRVLSDVIARLCEPNHTLHVNVWRILIEQLPKGFAETTWASGSKGAVGWHSLTYFCLTIIRCRARASHVQATKDDLHER